MNSSIVIIILLATIIPSYAQSAESDPPQSQNVHAAINVVSWGILLPVGAMIASILNDIPSAKPFWVYIHATCQLMGYVIGIIGGVNGYLLTRGPNHKHYSVHLTFTIIHMSTATIQVIGVFAKPKEGQKYSSFWNVFHHYVGYLTIMCGILNIFRGCDLIKKGNKWRFGYGGGALAFFLLSLSFDGIKYYINSRNHHHHHHSHGAQENS